MGDRPATLYLVGDGVLALDEPPDGEAGRSVATLPEAGVDIVVDAESAPAARPGARRLDRAALLAALAGAEFQQTF
jgi:hypothetical protein